MRVSMLGVRGSIPVSLPEMQGVGGATSSLALACGGDPPSLVLDGGTGLLRWSRTFGSAPFVGTVILGHLHWDHVMGLPFWPQLDDPRSQVRVLVPEAPGESGRQGALAALERLMSPPLFPIGPAQLRANVEFSTYGPGSWDVEGWWVTALPIPHRGGHMMGLRVEGGGCAMAYLSDHSPQDLGGGTAGVGEVHDAALRLCDRVDLLVHDAQYLASELGTRGGFGHAAMEYAAQLATASSARRLALFHHDPGRTDGEVEAAAEVASALTPVPVLVARDGLTVDLTTDPRPRGRPHTIPPSLRQGSPHYGEAWPAHPVWLMGAGARSTRDAAPREEELVDWPPLLALLEEPERRALLDGCRSLTFDRGAVVVQQGARGASLHVVMSGRLGVQIGTASGDTAIINVIGPGDYVGELSLVDAERPRRTASVVALEPTRTLAISAAAFRELRARHPAIQDLLITLLARRVTDLSGELMDALYSDLDVRVRHRLRRLAEAYQDSVRAPAGAVRVPLTQQQLASMVGGTRPSINQILGRLQDSGVLEVHRGSITIHNPTLLTD